MRKRLWIVRWMVSERDFIDSHRVFMADVIYETSSASFICIRRMPVPMQSPQLQTIG